MGLQTVQQHLAALLMEPATRQAFARSKKKTLGALGVRGRDALLLTQLNSNDLAYFATRRNVDRHHALRADLPKSIQLLESTRGRVQAYFRAHPYSLEDPIKEADRFARWAQQAAASGETPAALSDLARFEAALVRLSKVPRVAAKPSSKPRRAPNQLLLRTAVDVTSEAVLERAPDAAQEAIYVVLQAATDGVDWFRVEAFDHALLRLANGRRTRDAWLREVSRQTGQPPAILRASAKQLQEAGLLCPGP